MRFITFFLLTCSILFSTEIENISSDFTQTVTSTEDISLVYKGNFVAKKGDNLAFWNYTEPLSKQIYITNIQVIIVEPDLEQAIVTSLEQVADLSSILNDAIDKKGNNDFVEIELAEIKYKVFFSDNLPVKITYKDELENSVVIELFNTLTNQQIDEKIFEAKVPENYDIINY